MGFLVLITSAAGGVSHLSCGRHGPGQASLLSSSSPQKTRNESLPTQQSIFSRTCLPPEEGVNDRTDTHSMRGNCRWVPAKGASNWVTYQVIIDLLDNYRNCLNLLHDNCRAFVWRLPYLPKSDLLAFPESEGLFMGQRGSIFVQIWSVPSRLQHLQ